jgi:hypothetical protein
MPTVIFQPNSRSPSQRIQDRLEPYPQHGAQSYCGTVVTNPTRTITRCYLGGLQARQPLAPDTPQDPFNQVPTGGYGSASGNASGNPGDDIY